MKTNVWLCNFKIDPGQEKQEKKPLLLLPRVFYLLLLKATEGKNIQGAYNAPSSNWEVLKTLALLSHSKCKVKKNSFD